MTEAQFKAADEWTQKLCDKVFDKEMIAVPETIRAMAAIKYIAQCVNRSNVLTKAAAIQLLENALEEKTPAVN